MSANALTLAWTASTGTAPITYQPQYRLTGNSAWIAFGSPISVLTVTVTGLTPSTSYDFEVISSNPFGSATSAIVSGTTNASAGFPAPNAVAGNQATGTTNPVISGPQVGAVYTQQTLPMVGLTVTDTSVPPIVLAGSGGSFTDSTGAVWSISASNTVLRNGSAAGSSSNVVEIALVSNVVWQENNLSAWFSWNGTTWVSGTDPTTPVTLVVSCTSGTVAMTLNGVAVSGSGTQTITQTAIFPNCQLALATLLYTAPSAPTGDTISVKLTDQAGSNNTLLIPLQVSQAPAAVAPSAPTNLVPSAATNTTMRLDWAASATGTPPITYQAFFKLHTASSYTAFGSPVSGLTVTVAGLSAGTSYDFEIIASNAGGSATSAPATASTTNAATLPAAPTGLQVTGTTSTTMTFTWSASASGSTPITYQPQYRLTNGGGSGPPATRQWHQVIGGDRGLLTTPFQTTATWITSGTMINQLRALNKGNVRSQATTGFVSPFWISSSPSDILCTFHDSTGTIADFQMRVPAGAQSENSSLGAGDNSCGFIDTSRPYKYVTINDGRIGTNASNATSAGVVSATNNFIMCGPGGGSPGGMIVQDATGPTMIDAVTGSITPTIWENGDNVSGCITYYDLQQCNADPNYVIQHLVGLNLDRAVFGHSIVWPLVIGDTSGTGGTIPEGVIIGIPASTARPTGKSRGFNALFDLFQHFGAMFNNVTDSGIIALKAMPRDTATANLVADMNAQLVNIVPFLCILNYAQGTLGGQYSLATLKGRLATATAWSDAFPAPPPLALTETNGQPVLPSSFGAWQSANGLGQVYNTIWQNLPQVTQGTGGPSGPGPFVAFGSPISQTSVTITGLTVNTQYDLEVIAINSVGTATSAIVSATTGVAGIPTDTTGTQARPAQDLLNRFGVNTHFGSGRYAAFTPTQGVNALGAIGTTLVRDSENG